MALKNSKFNLGLLTDIWKNIDNIKEIIRIISIVVKHLKNLLEDLADDGKLNGSNLEN